VTPLNLHQVRVATSLIADGCDPQTANRIAAGQCPQCGGPVTETHHPTGIYGRCQRPWEECQGEYASAYPPNEETAPALDGEGAASTQDEGLSIYSTAPDPDAWTTSDQLAWLDTYR
jgi:hypothetical protein